MRQNDDNDPPFPAESDSVSEDPSAAQGGAGNDGDPLSEEEGGNGGVGYGGGALDNRLAEQQERYLRLAAEYDNFRKRTGREKAEAYSRAQGDLAKQLLDALDDLARFAHVDPASIDAATVVQGAEMVEKKMLKALSAAGLEIVNPVNQSFDPQLHEAVSTEPALSIEDDHVVSKVFQVGYLFNGQLLRPARVVVKQWNG